MSGWERGFDADDRPIPVPKVFLNVFVPPGKKKAIAVEATRHAFAYVFAGSGRFAAASAPMAAPTEAVVGSASAHSQEADNRSLVLFDRGDEIVIQAGDEGIRFLFVSGKPLEEPVSWYGPIVMNTKEEIRQAFAEYQAGTFLKHG